MSIHKELEESGLAKIHKINSITGNLELAKYLGKKVRYVEPYRSQCGAQKLIYTIKHTQLDYKGVEILRGYTDDNNFGRPININEIEILR